MSNYRVAVIPGNRAASLGMLRHHDEIDVATERDRIWVRVMRLHEDVERSLRNLPCAEHFDVSADGQLFPVGKRVPVGRLSILEWKSIASFARPSLPRPSLAGRRSAACGLTLRRSSIVQCPNVLVTDLSALVGYGCAAAEVRLNRWRFAVCADQRALVWGDPLPSLPGERYVERDGVAVPAGWQITPALESGVLAQVIGVGPGELVLFRPDAAVERIDRNDFVRATRSALRASLEASMHD